MLVKLQNSVFTVALSLYNINLTFIITYTVFQFHLNHRIGINQNPQLNLLALVDSKTLIKEMQRAMVNLYNHDELLVLGATNDTAPSPQNNSLGRLLPQKSIIMY